MRKLIICKGLPASGKTTWSREWVEEDPKRRIRVNRDDIRNMLGPYWIPTREDVVTDIENSCIKNGIWMGYDVVVDSTNLRGTGRFEYLETEGGVKFGSTDTINIVVQDFTDVPVDECIKRDSERTIGKVGEDVIRKMATKYGLL